jgi:hypothetical protein
VKNNIESMTSTSFINRIYTNSVEHIQDKSGFRKGFVEIDNIDSSSTTIIKLMFHVKPIYELTYLTFSYHLEKENDEIYLKRLHWACSTLIIEDFN